LTKFADFVDTQGFEVENKGPKARLFVDNLNTYEIAENFKD
jgi:hypothetical protein